MAPKKTNTFKNNRSFADVGLLALIAIAIFLGVLLLGVR